MPFLKGSSVHALLQYATLTINITIRLITDRWNRSLNLMFLFFNDIFINGNIGSDADSLTFDVSIMDFNGAKIIKEHQQGCNGCYNKRIR